MITAIPLLLGAGLLGLLLASDSEPETPKTPTRPVKRPSGTTTRSAGLPSGQPGGILASANPTELAEAARAAAAAGYEETAAVLNQMSRDAAAGTITPVNIEPDKDLTLSQALASHLRSAPPGGEDRAAVREWQEAHRNLYDGNLDGLYGPKTAKALSAYVWPPPAPRYWPRSNPDAAKREWHAFMTAGVQPVVSGPLAEDWVIVGGFFEDAWDTVKKAGKALGKIGKAIIKSPITKVIGVGLSFIVPPAGAAMTAAVIAADKVIRALESKDPKKRKAAEKIVANTQKASKRGSPGANAGIRALAIAKRLRKVHLAFYADYRKQKLAKGQKPKSFAGWKKQLNKAQRAFLKSAGGAKAAAKRLG
jgi:hypothetical protein